MVVANRRLPLFVRAAAGLALFFSSGNAADITVRVINGETGAPVPAYPIWLFWGKDATTRSTDGVTGQDGRLVFHVPEPEPEHFFAYPAAANVRSGCSDINFQTEEVLRRGVVEQNNCDRKHRIKEPIVAKPGDAVIFVRHIHWWEYLRGCWRDAVPGMADRAIPLLSRTVSLKRVTRPSAVS